MVVKTQRVMLDPICGKRLLPAAFSHYHFDGILQTGKLPGLCFLMQLLFGKLIQMRSIH